MTGKTLVSQWADLAPIPMVLLDEDLHLHWSNTAAGRLLQARTAVMEVEGALEAVHDPDQRILRDQVQEATCAPSLRVIGASPKEACLLIAQRLQGSTNRQVMLILRPADRLFHAETINFPDIRRLFRLTATEIRVVEHLLSSASPLEIAKASQIKIGTIRTHVRNIYAKMGVTSREGLFMRCLPFTWLDGVN